MSGVKNSDVSAQSRASSVNYDTRQGDFIHVKKAGEGGYFWQEILMIVIPPEVMKIFK